MTSLFIDLYLDEDVHVLVAELINRYGFTARTARQAEKLGCTDEEQLAYAARHRMTLLTHNRVDFEQLAQSYFHEDRTHCGIIIAVRRTPYEIVRHLLRILDQVTRDEMVNQVRYI